MYKYDAFFFDDMTYNVFGGTLSLTRSTILQQIAISRLFDQWHSVLSGFYHSGFISGRLLPDEVSNVDNKLSEGEADSDTVGSD